MRGAGLAASGNNIPLCSRSSLPLQVTGQAVMDGSEGPRGWRCWLSAELDTLRVLVRCYLHHGPSSPRLGASLRTSGPLSQDTDVACALVCLPQCPWFLGYRDLSWCRGEAELAPQNMPFGILIILSWLFLRKERLRKNLWPALYLPRRI